MGIDGSQCYLEANVVVCEHLADQLLLPLASAGRGSFRTLPLSSHAATNINIIRRFLSIRIEVEPQPDGTVAGRVGA